MKFKERAKLAAESLKKQGPVTFEQAKAQADWVRARIETKRKSPFKRLSLLFLFG
jgi:hypothetical protein